MIATAAYAQVRRMLLDGDIGRERPLAEIPLAARVGVSRPTMRETLRRLEGEGLLRSDGRRLRVVDLDGPELESALRMRAALEGMHAELVAERHAEGQIAPAQLRELEEKAARTDAATRAGDLAAAMRLNRDFHQALNRLAASPVSYDALASLWDRLLLSTGRSLAQTGREDAVHLEHLAVLSAVWSGDAARAGALAKGHVLRTLAALS